MNIWIVEDDAAYRRNLQRSLGLDALVSAVRAFPSAEDFFQALEEAGKPDGVLMDLGLPGMDGIEAIRRLSASEPGIAVVVLSVFQEQEKMDAALDAGAVGCIMKSSDGPEIGAALRGLFVAVERSA